MKIFLNKLETKEGREGGRKRDRKQEGKKEGMEERKKEGEKQTIEQRNKEKRKNQALVFEFHCFLSTFGIHTHSEYEFSQLTPR